MELGGGSARRVVYLKREHVVGLRTRLRNWLAGFGWSEEAAVTVVLASGGYPGPYETGTPIEGLEDAARVEGAVVFHAGTAMRDGRVVTAGGRVLAVSSLGSTIEQARVRAYEACSRLSFEGMRYRTDIAARAARDQGSAGSAPAAGTEPPRDEEER